MKRCVSCAVGCDACLSDSLPDLKLRQAPLACMWHLRSPVHTCSQPCETRRRPFAQGQSTKTALATARARRSALSRTVLQHAAEASTMHRLSVAVMRLPCSGHVWMLHARRVARRPYAAMPAKMPGFSIITTTQKLNLTTADETFKVDAGKGARASSCG
jgi:hypothetical protein